MIDPVLSRRQRRAFASCAALLSLPALLWTLVMPLIAAMVVLLSRPSWFDGDLAHAAKVLVTTAPHSGASATLLLEILAVVLYWGYFAWIIFRFWRGQRVGSYIQVYCLAFVLYAIGEKLFIELHPETVWDIWYGSLSSLHVLSLSALLLLERHKGLGSK